MSALTFDEPISSAAISGWSLLSANLPSALVDGLGVGRRDRLGQPNDHLVAEAKVEAQQPAAEQPGRLVELGELHQHRLRCLLTLGQEHDLARLKMQVPAAPADPGRRHQLRLERWDAGHKLVEFLTAKV